LPSVSRVKQQSECSYMMVPLDRVVYARCYWTWHNSCMCTGTFTTGEVIIGGSVPAGSVRRTTSEWGWGVAGDFRQNLGALLNHFFRV